MENDYQTPMKSQNGYGDGASTIAHGLSETKGMVESKIQHQQDDSQQGNDDERVLDSIEKQIHQIGRQLEELHFEMLKQTDKYSENFLDMEHKRNQLRKRLIDLDYQHKSVFARRMQESRRFQEEQKQKIRREFEEKQRARRQEREERERKRKQQLDKYEQQYRQKIRASLQSRKVQNSEKVSQKPSQENQEQTSQVNGQAQDAAQDVEDQLARSRRRLRIAQIQAELTQSRLRRSRIADLNTELDYLRYTYADPYYVYRPYVLPSYYYPYSAYSSPYYSRYWYY